MSENLADKVDEHRRALERTLEAVFADYRDETGFHVESVNVRYLYTMSGAALSSIEVTQRTLKELQR